jgi:hypothetical protein
VTSLQELVEAELAQAVDPRVGAMAEAIAALYPRAARAVLFYGSCLRTSEIKGQMLDFYLIVSSYRDAYGRSWMASANRFIPPNVFPFEHQGLAAKYAVLSEEDFLHLNGPETLSVSVWARFAQPSRLVWSAGPQAERACVAAISRAAPTLLQAAAPMMDAVELEPLDLWRCGFSLTYSAELRAERKNRAASVVESDPDRYRAFLGPAARAAGIGEMTHQGRLRLHPISDRQRLAARALWVKRKWAGKALSVTRLAKASGTYAGGIDYIAWKINRHAGTDFQITAWQRRWPLLGAITLLPRLLKRGAIR